MVTSLVFLMECLALLVISSAAPSSDFSGVLSRLYRDALKSHKPLVLVLDRSESRHRSPKRHLPKSESANEVYSDVVELLKELQRDGHQSQSLSKQQNHVLSAVSNLLSHGDRHSKSRHDRHHHGSYLSGSKYESSKNQLADVVSNVLQLVHQLDEKRKNKYFRSEQPVTLEEDDDNQSQTLSLFKEEEPFALEEDDSQVYSPVFDVFSEKKLKGETSLEENADHHSQVLSLLKGLSQPSSLEEEEEEPSQSLRLLNKVEEPVTVDKSLYIPKHKDVLFQKDDLKKQKLVSKVLNLLRADDKSVLLTKDVPQKQNVQDVLNVLEQTAPEKKSVPSLVKSLLALRNSLVCGQRDHCQRKCPRKEKKKCENICEEMFECDDEPKDECEDDDCEQSDSCGDDCSEQSRSTKAPPPFEEASPPCKRC